MRTKIVSTRDTNIQVFFYSKAKITASKSFKQWVKWRPPWAKAKMLRRSSKSQCPKWHLTKNIIWNTLHKLGRSKWRTPQTTETYPETSYRPSKLPPCLLARCHLANWRLTDYRSIILVSPSILCCFQNSGRPLSKWATSFHFFKWVYAMHRGSHSQLFISFITYEWAQ